MAHTQPPQTQERQNRKIIEHIHEQKKRLQHGQHSSMSVATGVNPAPIVNSTAALLPGLSAAEYASISNPQQRAALQPKKMPKRKKKTTAKKRKEEFSHEDTPPPAKKVDTTENEASSTSHIEEDSDQVQYFTSISIQNRSDANDLSHYWCNYCSFSTDTRKDLITHMRDHMNKCPFCSFASLSLKEVSKHSKIEHDKDVDAVSQESDSSSSCEMDKDPCSACIFCEFMTYSTEHLERHTVLKHPGMLAKSVAKMITKQSSAQIRRDDALFYLTISNENISEIKKSTTELHPIVIDMKPDLKSESRPILDDVRAKQATTLLKERGETIPTASSTSSENQGGGAKDEISSSGTVPDRKVKVETMYCLTCPYSNVYIEKLKCHTLAQHPLGAAVCTYNSSSENSTETDVTFFCIREDCSYNTGDCKAYQKHLMECCSCRSTMTVLEKERLQASIAYINSFQKKTCKDAERGFSNFVQSFLNNPDSSSSSVFQNNSNIIAAGRDPLCINKDNVPKSRSLPEMQRQVEGLMVSRHGLTTNTPVPGGSFDMVLPDIDPRKTPDMDGAEIKTNLVNTSEQLNPGVLAFKLASDILHSSIGSSINQHQLSSSTSSDDSAIRNKQQSLAVDLSNSILMSGDCGSEMSQPQNSQENLRQSADPLLRSLPIEGKIQGSDVAPFYHDGLNHSAHLKSTLTVIDLDNETWQKSQHNSSTFISPQQNNISLNQSSLKIPHDEMSTTINQTSVPNFLVTTNSPIPETESNIESQTQQTFLTPSKNPGLLTHSLSTPPKNTNNLANAAGSSPLSPSIYLSGQAPRHKRGNWTEADMRPRNIMMPPVPNMVSPQFAVPPVHVRQQLFTSGNTRGRSGRGRARLPHNSRQNASVDDDDDVIFTAFVRNNPNIHQPAVRRGGIPSQPGRMAPMPRHPFPPSPTNRGRSLFSPQAAPPKQFDISKHFEDLACVVNSTGDESDGNLEDDDIQILGVTPGNLEKEKTKHPRAVDASKFSFSCLHCGKDQGSKMQMKHHMKAHHNDSLIGAFTNVETGQLLFFCPQLTCEFMTYEEQRLSEHLYKCYNLDHSKPFDVITAIKNLKSVKIRQLDVKSMGRFQDNSAYLDGQGLKDNFTNSLNDAFGDIVVNASGRHMPKVSPVPRQVPPPLVHPNSFVSPRHSSGPCPPIRLQSGHPAPKQRFYPSHSQYSVRLSNNEIPRLAHHRLPSPRLDMRMARGMFPRSRGQARSPMRPLLTGPRFGGEQEPIVIDDEPSFPVSNIFHSEQSSSSLSLSGTAPSSERLISDHSPATTFDDVRHEENYSSKQGTVNCSSSHQPLSVTGEISNQYDINGSARPVHMHAIARQAYSDPDILSSNPPVLLNESVTDKAQLPSLASGNMLDASVSSTVLNNSVLNTPGTNVQASEASSSEALSVGAIEDASFEEEEKSYANMLEKVFAKVPNMPKKLSHRLISKFKQYSKDIGAKITSNVIDEFVSKISYRGSTAAKVIPFSAPSVTEQSETSSTPNEHIERKRPDDIGEAPPDHTIPDVLTTQVIMAERELKFSGSFANLPLNNNEVTSANIGGSGVSSCQETPVQEQNSSSTENLQSDEPISKSDSNSSEQLDGSSPNLQSQKWSLPNYGKYLNENPFIMQSKRSNVITRRHSTDIINAKSDTIRDIRSSSCPLTSTKDLEWRIGKTTKSSASFPPYTRKVKKNISTCIMTVTAEVHVPTIQAVIDDDCIQPAILHKENSLSLISSSPILITSNVDHLVSGHADLEVDIAGKPENHNLLMVEKLEPLDTLDHVLSDSLDQYSPSCHDQEEHASANAQGQKAPVLLDAKHNNEAASRAIKKTAKKTSAAKKQKTKNDSLIDSKTGRLIPKVFKRGKPRSKVIGDGKSAGENTPHELSELVDTVKDKPSSVCDVQADQNESFKDNSEIKETVADIVDTKPLKSNEAEIQEASSGRDMTEKEDNKEKSNEGESLNKDASGGNTEIFVRRSDRKRKCIKSDYRGEEGAELDDLLDDSDEDYTFDEDYSDNDESTWMKESGLAHPAKKKVKKVKPPPDPTAFNMSTKGQFRCWRCKKVFLKSTCAKAHLLKKHKEGLCSIDLVQTEETNVLHLLLYCIRDCKYATFSLEGYKSHMASCQKPEYTSQDDNYLESNKTFIDVLYPELVKTDAKDFLSQSQKVNKSCKTKKSKTSKDKVAVTVDDISGNEQSSISPPLQGAASETVSQTLTQPSSLNPQHSPQITSPAIQNKLFLTSSDQQISRIAIPPVPRLNAGQHNQRIITHPDGPKTSSDLNPPKLSPQPPRLTAEHQAPRYIVEYRAPKLPAEHSDPRLSAEHRAPRISSEHHSPRLIPEQCSPRISPIQHPSVTFDQTGSRFPEHPAKPVRPPMQSKHNLAYQSPSYIRPANLPVWQQAQKIPGARYAVDDRQIHQGPRLAQTSSQTVSGQAVNFKVQDVSSSTSHWQNSNHSNVGQQDIDNVYVEENGTICLE
ncbi:hypothetical protein Btru_076775 [Bulinus truncatus]|nr:hypothetical protein Btru_076775 [Bulinus truncatus]